MKYLLSFSRNAEEKLVVERNICPTPLRQILRSSFSLRLFVVRDGAGGGEGVVLVVSFSCVVTRC